MNRFRAVFGDGKVVLPVIHVESLEQALRNVEIAYEANANGVWLIGHGMGWDRLMWVYNHVRAAFPEVWIGVNFLDLKAHRAAFMLEAAHRLQGPRKNQPRQATVRARQSPRVEPPDGLWTDNARINEYAGEQPAAQKVLDSMGEWDGLYFGGVAFKHQREVSDLVTAAQQAALFMDVVTTSGPATGVAAHLDKLRVMKEALVGHPMAEKPLAVASGVTVENVGDTLPFVDCYLVATGISESFHELDPDKTKALVDKVHG